MDGMSGMGGWHEWDGWRAINIEARWTAMPIFDLIYLMGVLCCRLISKELCQSIPSDDAAILAPCDAAFLFAGERAPSERCESVVVLVPSALPGSSSLASESSSDRCATCQKRYPPPITQLRTRP